MTRRWQRSARGSRRTSAANTAGPPSPCAAVGWCGAGWRLRGAARGARRPWWRTCGPSVGPARAPARRSSTATAATRRDHVRPAITAGQRPRPDFWHPTGLSKPTGFTSPRVHPARAGRRRGCWPRRGCRDGRRPVPGGAGQGVLVEFAGLLILTQLAQVGREPAGRGEGVGVVVAQHPPEAGEGVVLELAGLGARPPPKARPRWPAVRSVSGSSSPCTWRLRAKAAFEEPEGLLLLAQRAQDKAEQGG